MYGSAGLFVLSYLSLSRGIVSHIFVKYYLYQVHHDTQHLSSGSFITER